MIAEKMSRLLLIAGTGRDCGKTTFACHVIRRFKDVVPLIAVKISPHRHTPLQGGAVITDDEDLYIAEETSLSTGKDSSRMLAAGAHHSYFIMASDEMLLTAFDNIVTLGGKESFYICESGGLRRYVKPGLFIFIIHVEETLRKPDNDRLKDMADAAFTFGGNKHDFDPGRIMIEDNCWKIKNLS